MALIVQKYGGTSVADPDHIHAVADNVAFTKKRGNDVIVVVSAMGKATDNLITLADSVSRTQPGREMDMLLTAGERIATVTLSPEDARLLEERGEVFFRYGTTGQFDAGVLTITFTQDAWTDPAGNGQSYTYDANGDLRSHTVWSPLSGDVIEVKLTLIAPTDLYYVVVEDPLPAGFEGVDLSLKTSSVVGERPSLERVRAEDEQDWYRWYGWGWWWFSHSEMRDEKVALFAKYLPRGTYEYSYLMRAGVPGEFLVTPATAYEMYFPEVFGRSDGGRFVVKGGD